jgi:ubiquinone/menaquinone biosynthesis C-methylase UbiE
LSANYSRRRYVREEADYSIQRDKAFAIFPYPCIGRWRFLDLYVTSTPQYPTLIERLKGGDSLLDVGCCFGHILRQLAHDGAPASNIAGTDLRPEFVDLGYELFRDRDTFAAPFITGDILDPANTSLAVLDGKYDILHTASFFHLFGWDDQVRVGERIVRFFKPDADALVLGRQVGTFSPVTVEEFKKSGGRRYLHNVETMQNLWDEIGKRTATKWKVSGRLFESRFDEIYRVIIWFEVTKVD